MTTLAAALDAPLDRLISGPLPRGWLWVTDAGRETGTDDWWTCHQNTEAGDLVLLYRKRPASAVAELLRTTSRARPARRRERLEPSWHTVCHYEVVTRFATPVAYRDICADPLLDAWRRQSRNFQLTATDAPAHVLRSLLAMAGPPPTPSWL